MRRNTRKRMVLFSLLLLGITACSNTTKLHANEHFLTHISSTNLKLFEMRILLSREQLEARARQHPKGRQLSSKERHERNHLRVKKLAKTYNAINGYCQEGFWVIEYDTDSRGEFLRGECNDLATTEDRNRYPNTIRQW